MDLVMYDSVTVGEIPSNAPAVAGYVGGRFSTFETLVANFPHALRLSLAVNASEIAHGLDIENGDAVPAQAPGWVHDGFLGSGKPVLYESASEESQVVAAMNAAGFPRGSYLLWSAHYGRGSHVCGPSTCGFFQTDGTQWTDTALGRNLDQSIVTPEFFGPLGPPPDPFHYARYPLGPFREGRLLLNERATVEEYDRLILNPRRNAARIAVLRSHIRYLRDRVWTVAHRDHPPSWDFAYRGWRWQKLNQRLKGKVSL